MLEAETIFLEASLLEQTFQEITEDIVSQTVVWHVRDLRHRIDPPYCQ